MPIRVLVNGAFGKMGQEAVKAIEANTALTLVGQTGQNDSLSEAISANKPQVVVDLTNAKAVFNNASCIIEHQVHPVIGTSGLLPEDISTLQKQASEQNLGGIIVPNFSIGAVLMMEFAQRAARYYSDIEVIEMHHEEKLDAPSGTAIRTAEIVSEVSDLISNKQESIETVSGARGAKFRDIPIHSIRLPGVVARQDVVFGGQGETLTISHNSVHRNSFMPGLCLACEKVMNLSSLEVGLEHLL